MKAQMKRPETTTPRGTTRKFQSKVSLKAKAKDPKLGVEIESRSTDLKHCFSH